MSDKVAHIAYINNLPPTKDGSFNYLIYDIVKIRKNDIVICFHSDASFEKNKLEKLNVFYVKHIKINKLIKAKEYFLKRIISPWNNHYDYNHRNFVNNVNKIIKREKVSHVVVWGSTSVLRCLRAKNSEVKITFAQRHFEYSSNDSVYELANTVLMQNYGQYKLALSKYLQIPTKVVIIPNGVETDVFKPLKLDKIKTLRKNFKINEDDFVIIYPSKFAPHKGAFLLPDLMFRLSKLNIKCKLLIVGNKHPKYNRGKFKIDYELLEKQLNQLENIIWIKDGVQRSEMKNFYNISDVAIYPTFLKEGFSMSSIEAMSCGLPILAPNAGCYLETIKDGETGFILNQENMLNELVSKIANLFRNPLLKNEIGVNARQYITQKLTREKLLNNFIYYLDGKLDLIDSEI
jgi:spore coat protein SA